MKTSAIGDRLARVSREEADQILSGLSAEQLEELQHDWTAWARPEQLAPAAGNDGTPWNTWMYLAGRGTGKTRTGCEWLKGNVCGATPLGAGRFKRIAIIGETSKDVRDVLIEGESGLLGIHRADFRPHYQPSISRLVWPNGAIATLYNGTEPDQLRGPQFDAALVDELAKYQYAQETWDMLMFGLRLGDHPQAMVTTTPRPIPIIKELLNDPKTAITRGKTYDNSENLAAPFLAKMKAKYEGTRLGRQELSAEILDDVPNALWRRTVLDEHRIVKRGNAYFKGGSPFKMPDMLRVLVSVDPAAKAKETQRSEHGAETGIITVGLGVDSRGYVFDDSSTDGGPNEWARRAVASCDLFHGDAIVAETNNGGDMVEFVIRSVRPTVKVIQVVASRGKVTRAEPISALYEQGRVSHVGGLSALEDQMCAFTTTNAEDRKLKDRVDALVWGFTELFPDIVNIQEPMTPYSPPILGPGSWML